MTNIKKTISITVIALSLLILNSFKIDHKKDLNIPQFLPINKNDIIRISSGFGKKTNSSNKIERTHEGIDFIAYKGTPILAAGNGEVIFSGFSKTYGNHIIIKHNDTYQSLYAHMNTLNVEKEQKVKAKETIGIIGSTGKATGIHLHYEVIKNGIKIDPNPLFNN